MMFHENRLLADDSHEISYLIFFENWKMSSAAVMIGALRVNYHSFFKSTFFTECCYF